MHASSLDRLGMLVVHAFVDSRSRELHAAVTFAADLTGSEATTQLARSRDEVLELVRMWLDGSNGAGDGPVTPGYQDRANVIDPVLRDE